jgi:hypothetical protein
MNVAEDLVLLENALRTNAFAYASNLGDTSFRFLEMLVRQYALEFQLRTLM